MIMRQVDKEEVTARPKGRVFLSGFGKKGMPDLRAHIIFWFLTAGGLALDLWTKKAVFDFLRQKPGLRFTVIDGFLSLVMAKNKGAAFGIFEGQRIALTAISLIALLIVLCVFFFSDGKQKLFYVVLGLFAAGICGNLYDRLFNSGQVRDFIEVIYWPGLKPWPAFNVADSLLCIAVALVLIVSFIQKPSGKHARQHK